MKRPLIFLLLFSALLQAQSGKLVVGFDIDDTVLFSRDVFLQVPGNLAEDAYWSWINTHDDALSVPIPPTIELVKFFHAKGHDVVFITSRPGIKGRQLARYLSKVVGFKVKVDDNLFFSPSEKVKGHKYPTKQEVMLSRQVDLYYGDSDGDIIAAIKADVHPVRVIRHQASWQAYGANYFGNVLKSDSDETPFRPHDLPIFYKAHVGVFGESIYPIVWAGPDSVLYNY